MNEQLKQLKKQVNGWNVQRSATPGSTLVECKHDKTETDMDNLKNVVTLNSYNVCSVQ